MDTIRRIALALWLAALVACGAAAPDAEQDAAFTASVKVLDYRLVDDIRGVAVEGRVQNVGSKPLQLVTVGFNGYDPAGEIAGYTAASLPYMQPGDVARFRAAFSQHMKYEPMLKLVLARGEE